MAGSFLVRFGCGLTVEGWRPAIQYEFLIVAIGGLMIARVREEQRT